MLISGSQDEWDASSSAENAAGMQSVYAWFGKWGEAGKIADGGARLDRPDTARTVRAGATSPIITDGPAAELKEVLGGIVMLLAADLDEAVAIAATWPTLQGSTSLEVRPILET